MRVRPSILCVLRSQARAALWLAITDVASACSDSTIIGALCPAGCKVQARDNICDCSMAIAGRSAEQPDAGDSTEMPDAAISGSEACAPGSYALAPVLGNLVVGLDNSSSLLPWWASLSEGFLRFIEEDASRGLGVSVLRFADVCEATSYLPPQVPLAALPENLAPLQAATASGGVELTTSTVPLLSAALRYARDWADAHADMQVAVLLISDASPGVCDGLVGDYQAEAVRLASEAYAATPAIATYAIGGDGLDNIKPIAMGGGTQALQINTLDTSDMVLEAMRAIRSRLRACTLSLPAGVTLAADSQVIAMLPGGAQRTLTIGRGAAACSGDGFYSETNQGPLHACSGTCAAVSGGELASAKLSLSSACKSRP
jgi:hypothetical protein